MTDFAKLAQMKPGDVFYECEMGVNIRARVLTAPVASKEGHEGRRTLRWTAENTEDGKQIDYLLTEGWEHYGPRIYDQPQYCRWHDGELQFPLLGAGAA